VRSLRFGPISGATDEQMAVSLARVRPHALALLIFRLSNGAELTQTQFGLWAALAIHDTSSVVGGGRKVRGRGSSGGHHGQTGPSAFGLFPVHRDGGDKSAKAKIQWPSVLSFLLPGGSV